MTQVTSGPFTVRIIDPADAYSGYTLGQFTRIWKYGDGGLNADGGICSYSGGAYDSATGRFWIFGGGHEVWNNEVWEFNVNSPTTGWTQHYTQDHPGYFGSQTPPDTIANVYADTNFAVYPGKWLSSGRPIARHTRYSMCWMPDIQKFIASGSSLAGGAGLGTSSIPVVGYPQDGQETWLYNPSSHVWDWKGSYALNTAYLRPINAVFHTVRQKLYSYRYPLINNRVGIIEYNATLNNWVDHYDGTNPNTALTPSPADSDGGLLAIDSANDRIIALINSVSLGRRVFEYSISTKTWSAEKSVSGTAPGSSAEGAAFLFSPSSQRATYITATGVASYLHCPVGGAWSWGTWSFTFPNCAQLFNRAIYCPVRDVAFFAYANTSTGSVDVYAARL